MPDDTSPMIGLSFAETIMQIVDENMESHPKTHAILMVIAEIRAQDGLIYDTNLNATLTKIEEAQEEWKRRERGKIRAEILNEKREVSEGEQQQ